MQAVFIVNPSAQGGKALERWGAFKETVTFPYQEFMTNGPGHATIIARGFAAHRVEEDILLIAFGGDGTVHEMIAGAVGAGHVIIGSIGAGSGNDFGRGFLSFNSAEMIEAFLTGEGAAPSLDLGLIDFQGGQIFVNSAGIGFDAMISRRSGQSRMKPLLNRVGLGKLVYALYIARTLFAFKTFPLDVVADGELRRYRDVWFATVSNQPYFGGGMKISPESDPSDGMIELTIVSRLSKVKLLLVFGSVFWGAHTGFKEVESIQGRSFELKANCAVPLHADGEDTGDLTPGRMVTFSVRPESWRLAGQQRTGRLGINNESTP